MLTCTLSGTKHPQALVSVSRCHMCLAQYKTRGYASLSKPHTDSQAGRNEWTTHHGVLLNESLATELPRNKQTNKSSSPATGSRVPGGHPARVASAFVGSRWEIAWEGECN